LIEGKVVQIPDVLNDPDYALGDVIKKVGARTMLGVPLLREGSPVGVIVLTRRAVQPFSEKQIELVTTFADQAVIAIENVRLFDEVQARTRELSESLEQQTATSEVLGVISKSPGDLEPVFQASGDVAQPRGGEVERRLTVRKRAHDTGAPPDLAQDALERVVGANPPPMLLWEGVVGERLLDCHFHQLGGAAQAQATQLLDHSDGLLARCGDVLAGVDRLEHGRDLPHLGRGHVAENVAVPVHCSVSDSDSLSSSGLSEQFGTKFTSENWNCGAVIG